VHTPTAFAGDDTVTFFTTPPHSRTYSVNVLTDLTHRTNIVVPGVTKHYQFVAGGGPFDCTRTITLNAFPCHTTVVHLLPATITSTAWAPGGGFNHFRGATLAIGPHAFYQTCDAMPPPPTVVIYRDRTELLNAGGLNDRCAARRYIPATPPRLIGHWWATSTHAWMVWIGVGHLPAHAFPHCLPPDARATNHTTFVLAPLPHTTCREPVGRYTRTTGC